MDRTRLGSTVFAVSSGQGTPSIVLNTTIPATAGPGIGYYQIGDVIQVNDSRTLGLVTAISTYTNVTAFQQVTLLKVDPTGSTPNWSAATCTTNFSLGHVFSAFAEGSNGPNGRVFLPVEDFNYTLLV